MCMKNKEFTDSITKNTKGQENREKTLIDARKEITCNFVIILVFFFLILRVLHVLRGEYSYIILLSPEIVPGVVEFDVFCGFDFNGPFDLSDGVHVVPPVGPVVPVPPVWQVVIEPVRLVAELVDLAVGVGGVHFTEG